MRAAKNIFLFLAAIVLLITVFFSYFFTVIKIDSSGMSPSFEEGDYVLIRKQKTLPNRGDLVAFHIPDRDSFITLHKDLNYYDELRKITCELALKGDTITNPWAEIRQRNAVHPLLGIPYKPRKRTAITQLLFEDIPQEIQRCVGLPGDTVELRNGALFINNQRSSFFKGKQSNKTPNSTPKICSYLFPHQQHYFNWNKDNYGPIVLPKLGDVVPLNDCTIQLYGRILYEYENRPWSRCGDSFFVQQKYSISYTFRNNYYWMLNDQREDADDSRHWGHLSIAYITGKPVIVIPIHYFKQ